MTEPPDLSDHYVQKGAIALAARIEKFWRDRGHRSVWAEAFQLGVPGRYFGVRSNLVNGLPPADGRGRHNAHWNGPRKRVLEPRIGSASDYASFSMGSPGRMTKHGGAA